MKTLYHCASGDEKVARRATSGTEASLRSRALKEAHRIYALPSGRE
ncbi:MAG TPA: hypothetical protein VGC66_03400 [Pyrinomonadaceae bacterium]